MVRNWYNYIEFLILVFFEIKENWIKINLMIWLRCLLKFVNDVRIIIFKDLFFNVLEILNYDKN